MRSTRWIRLCDMISSKKSTEPALLTSAFAAIADSLRLPLSNLKLKTRNHKPLSERSFVGIDNDAGGLFLSILLVWFSW